MHFKYSFVKTHNSTLAVKASKVTDAFCYMRNYFPYLLDYVVTGAAEANKARLLAPYPLSGRSSNPVVSMWVFGLDYEPGQR